MDYEKTFSRNAFIRGFWNQKWAFTKIERQWNSAPAWVLVSGSICKNLSNIFWIQVTNDYVRVGMGNRKAFWDYFFSLFKNLTSNNRACYLLPVTSEILCSFCLKIYLITHLLSLVSSGSSNGVKEPEISSWKPCCCLYWMEGVGCGWSWCCLWHLWEGPHCSSQGVPCLWAPWGNVSLPSLGSRGNAWELCLFWSAWYLWSKARWSWNKEHFPKDFRKLT